MDPTLAFIAGVICGILAVAVGWAMAQAGKENNGN